VIGVAIEAVAEGSVRLNVFPTDFTIAAVADGSVTETVFPTDLTTDAAAAGSVTVMSFPTDLVIDAVEVAVAVRSWFVVTTGCVHGSGCFWRTIGAWKGI
jgi:hypothetical protein